MIKNLWKKVVLYCGCHEEEVKLSLKEGVGNRNLFYSCPKYYPENRDKLEKACANHISSEDLEKVVDHLSEMMENEISIGNSFCLTGHEWKWKFYQFKILEHTNETIKISVKNKKALA